MRTRMEMIGGNPKNLKPGNPSVNNISKDLLMSDFFNQTDLRSRQTGHAWAPERWRGGGQYPSGPHQTSLGHGCRAVVGRGPGVIEELLAVLVHLEFFGAGGRGPLLGQGPILSAARVVG